MKPMRLVADKSNGRIVFACDLSVQALWETVWPPTAYSYFHDVVSDYLVGSLRTTPWEFSYSSNAVEKCDPPADTTKFELDAAKARLLIELTKAIHRHRRVVMKLDLHGQERVYQMKRGEAHAVRSKMDVPTPMIAAEAALMGITKEQVANLILFRAEQADSYMVYSEANRRSFTVRITELSDITQIPAMRKEIRNYELRF